MSYKNEMQTMRAVLLGEQADRRKLDMLVRQGMMSPAALPMLHRGLDKLQAGKTLSPQERDAVAKVVDSLLYIVTGDDTVFQKAKMHTQRNRYQTEEQDPVLADENPVTENGQDALDEKMDLAKADMGDVIKDFKKSDAPQFKGKSDKKKREMAIAAKLGAEKEDMKEEDKIKCDKCDGKGCKHCDDKGYHTEGYFKSLDTDRQEKERLAKRKNTMIANPKTQKVRKVTPERAKSAVKKGFVYAEEWTDAELDALFEMEYKDKFQAMLKKTGKSLASMSDEEKKKFFNTVDAAHNSKNEAYDTPAVKKPVSQMTPAEKKKNDERRSAYNTFQKRQRDNEKAVKDMKGMAPHMKNPALGEEVEMVNEAPTPAQRAAAAAKRDMRKDSRGMAPVKKSGDLGGTGKYNKSKNDNIEKHGGHIVTQMKKAITVGKPVKFKDGSEKVVSKAHAHKYLSKYMSGKPAQKVDMHGAHDSHDAFMKHVS